MLVVTSSQGQKTRGLNCLLILEPMEPSQFFIHGSQSIIFKHNKQMRSDWQSVTLISASNPERWTGHHFTCFLATENPSGPCSPVWRYKISPHRELFKVCAVCPGGECAAGDGGEEVLFRPQVMKQEPLGDVWG